MKDSVQRMDFRADFYRLLSSLFLHEVSLEFLKNLSSSNQASPNFEGLILTEGNTWETLKEELDVDFARIFLGLGPLTAFPYESIYKGSLGLLMQKPFEEVREFYGKAGIKKNPDLKEPDDHIGIELAFMVNLCSQAKVALKNDKKEEVLSLLERQKQFLQNHLLTWVPSLCKDIQTAAQTDFYKSLAALLNSWISSDSQELNSLIEWLKSKGRS